MNSQEKPFIIFLHIHKTGGLTLQRILRQKYAPDIAQRGYGFLKNIWSSNDHEIYSDLESCLKARKTEDRYFAGHINFGVHELLPKPYTYITILREPISRLISLYFYSVKETNSYYHSVAKKYSGLEDFLLHSNLLELDNGQLRFIYGGSKDHFIDRTPFGQCTEAMLEQAKKNIEESFSLVGIMEKYDESMLLLKQILNWNSCFYIRRNTSKSDNSYKSIDPKILNELVTRNSLDIQLYKFAKDRLEKKIQTQSFAFEEDLYQFKKMNKFYNSYAAPMYNIYEQAKFTAKKSIASWANINS